MKLSLSIIAYQKSIVNLLSKIADLNFDYFHVDSINDPTVFDTISVIRQYSDKPIDLHLVTDNPELYLSFARTHQVERISIQYELLSKEGKNTLSEFSDLNIGLSIGKETPIEELSLAIKDFSFIQLMSGTPGISGGVFDERNIGKMQWLKQHYPTVSIEIDGGVNHEMMHHLEGFNVTVIVSGSYVFKNQYWGRTIDNLKNSLTTV